MCKNYMLRYYLEVESLHHRIMEVQAKWCVSIGVNTEVFCKVEWLGVVIKYKDRVFIIAPVAQQYQFERRHAIMNILCKINLHFPWWSIFRHLHFEGLGNHVNYNYAIHTSYPFWQVFIKENFVQSPDFYKECSKTCNKC